MTSDEEKTQFNTPFPSSRSVPFHYGSREQDFYYYDSETQPFYHDVMEECHPSYSRALLPIDSPLPVGSISRYSGDYISNYRGFSYSHKEYGPPYEYVPQMNHYRSSFPSHSEYYHRPLSIERPPEMFEIRKHDLSQEKDKEIKNYEVKIDTPIQITPIKNEEPSPNASPKDLESKENEDDNRTHPHHQKKKIC